MKYAGFSMRFGAGIVDALVFLPVLGLYWCLTYLSWEVAVAATVPYVFAYAAYNVYLHARWGQTIGKRVYGIRVVTLAGQPIRWRHALLRHSVDLLVAAVTSVAWMAGLFALSKATFESAGLMDRMHLVKEARLSWEYWPQALGSIWIGSELLVLLLNEKKRAIHDYLAGTVVVVLPAKTSSGRRHTGGDERT